MNTDPNAPYEGRSNMREVTKEEFDVYRREHPNGDWSVVTPVGQAGPERYFVPA